MKEHNTTEAVSFSDLGVKPKILDVLQKMHITEPTPIQRQAIPVALKGGDLIGIAQTGTGKTLAFGIPMLLQLSQKGGKGLVLLPTRELAMQVNDNMRALGGSFGLRTASLIGGEAIGKQMAQMQQKPHVIIATPGRLIDMIKRRVVSLTDVKVLVLDEADLMLDMGFMPQVEEIVKTIPKTRQTMLFSATMPTAIAKLAAQQMHLPVTIEVAPAGTTAERVEQEMMVMRKEDKIVEIEKILNKYKGTVLIFARTRRGAQVLTDRIKKMGHAVAEIHSNRSFEQRKKALAGFKGGTYRILVATDIAARGIDVKEIELVVNYDLPDSSDDYVHRIGRTARAGQSGRAISFATPDQYKDVKSIEKLINMEIALVQLAEFNQSVARTFSARGKGAGRSKFASRGSMNTMQPVYRPSATRQRPTPIAPPKKIKETEDYTLIGEAFGGGLQPYRPYAAKVKEMGSPKLSGGHNSGFAKKSPVSRGKTMGRTAPRGKGLPK